MKDNSDYINTILAKHFAKEPLTEELEEAFIQWVTGHQKEYNALSKVMVRGTCDVQKAWEKVSAQLQPKTRTVNVNFRKILAYAAVIAVVFGVSLHFMGKKSTGALDFANSGTALMTVALPDSSTVVLYPQSSVSYIASADGRQVDLSGEAFFKVRKHQGMPFVVMSDEVEVRVMGTSFLVKEDEGRGTEVAVREGLVQVTAAGSRVLLKANEQARVYKEKLEKQEIRQPEEVFRNHIVEKVYRQVPLSQILQEVSGELGVEVTAPGELANLQVSTTIKMTQIDEILSELSYICNCKYRKVSDKKYVLSKH